MMQINCPLPIHEIPDLQYVYITQMSAQESFFIMHLLITMGHYITLEITHKLYQALWEQTSEDY